MALPKIDLPISETKLPSTGEVIQYRNFTVKEEKIMLVAQEAANGPDQVMAVKQVINNCLLNKDITELSMFDLEYMMLVLRAKSIDNMVKFNVVDPETEESVQLELNIDDVRLIRNEEHNNKVPINEQYTLFLKYPTIDEFIKISEMDSNDPLVSYIVMVSCLDSVASEDEAFHFKDYTSAEIDDFMDGISAEVVSGIQRFFETMPKIRHELKYTNKNGTEQTFVVEGMRTFFI